MPEPMKTATNKRRPTRNTTSMRTSFRGFRRLSALERLEQTRGDVVPAPPLHCGSAGRPAELRSGLGRKGEKLFELGCELPLVPPLEAGEVPLCQRILGFQAERYLGEAGMPRDQGRSAGGRSFSRNHPERLGEDRGDDRDVRQGQSVDEVTVFKGSGEQRPRRRHPLQLLAVVAE